MLARDDISNLARRLSFIPLYTLLKNIPALVYARLPVLFVVYSSRRLFGVGDYFAQFPREVGLNSAFQSRSGKL